MGMTPPPAQSWRITINPERVSSLWWDFARARFDAPAALAPMLEPLGVEELFVAAEEGAAIRSWAATVPDWDETLPPLLIEQREA
jgi:hypothetical protein